MAPAQAKRSLLLLGCEPFIHRLTAAPAKRNGVIERQPSLERPGRLIGELDHHRIASDFLLKHHSLGLDANATDLIRTHRLARRQQSQSHCPTNPVVLRVPLLRPRSDAALISPESRPSGGSARTPRQRPWLFTGAAWSLIVKRYAGRQCQAEWPLSFSRRHSGIAGQVVELPEGFSTASTASGRRRARGCGARRSPILVLCPRRRFRGLAGGPSLVDERCAIDALCLAGLDERENGADYRQHDAEREGGQTLLLQFL
jgi:hypothetical protein